MSSVKNASVGAKIDPLNLICVFDFIGTWIFKNIVHHLIKGLYNFYQYMSETGHYYIILVLISF